MRAPSDNLLRRVADRVNWRTISGPLFRKYVGLFIAVVCIALITSGAFEVYFAYHEHKAALIRIQREQAAAAAKEIDQFIEGIKSQVGWTTQLPWSAGMIDSRRFDGLRLLRQVPAITELSQLDSEGRERLRVSRLSMDELDKLTDYSKDPKFTEAVAKKVYYGPVYFRRESEPYMTLSLAGTRRDAGVSVAEVNLKLIWEVVSQIKVGERGHAYVIDAQGRLIAHPDISLVLRNTDMTRLTQVQAARAAVSGAAQEPVQEAQDIQGRKVLTAYAPVTGPGWTIFVELPSGEAYAPLFESIAALGASAAARAGARGGLRHVPGAPHGRADPGPARGRGAHRLGRSAPAHFDQDRRRARNACRPVQRHGRQARGFLCRPREEGRGPHPRAHRIRSSSRPRPPRCCEPSPVRRAT